MWVNGFVCVNGLRLIGLMDSMWLRFVCGMGECDMCWVCCSIC